MRRILLIFLVLGLVVGGYFIYIKYKGVDSGITERLGIFFPTGETVIPSDGTSQGKNTSEEGTSTSPDSSQFNQITSRPVAGYTVFSRIIETTTPPTDPKQKPTTQRVVEHVIRYVSRSNGFVYEIVNGGTPLQITNIYIPNVYEAYFADNNKTAIIRFLREDQKTIATYSIPVPDPNPDYPRTQKEGTFLPDDIKNLSKNPNQNLYPPHL